MKYYILFFSFFILSDVFGQIEKIKVRKQDTSEIVLTLSKKESGSISISELIKDPTIRLERGSEKNYILKEFEVSIVHNWTLSSNTHLRVDNKDAKLTSEEIEYIRQCKKGYYNNIEDKVYDIDGTEIKRSKKEYFNNTISIKNVVVSDINGALIKLKGIMLTIISPKNSMIKNP